MPHPASRIAPRIARLLLLAVPLLSAACHVPTRRGATWEGGADGFNTAELAASTDNVACLEAEIWPGDLRLGAIEGGADGFTETGYAPEQPHCVAGVVGGWRAAGGWGVLSGWTPFGGPPAEEGGARPNEFSGLWGGSAVPVSSFPGLSPFLGLWPTGGPAIRLPAGEGDPENPGVARPLGAASLTGEARLPGEAHLPGEDLPSGEDGSEEHETLLVLDPNPRPAVPPAIAEPATLLLFGGALVVLGLLRRERDSDPS